jgi:hypothetical protein
MMRGLKAVRHEIEAMIEFKLHYVAIPPDDVEEEKKTRAFIKDRSE